MDKVSIKQMLEEINQALIENLAAELGFPSFEKLENSSECIYDEYYVTYLSDGRWVWWNPQTYKSEDPIYFEDKEEITKYISDFLGLDKQQNFQLRQGLSEIVQMRKCLYCEHEFDPTKVSYSDGDTEHHQKRYCSTECAMEALMGELKEDY